MSETKTKCIECKEPTTNILTANEEARFLCIGCMSIYTAGFSEFNVDYDYQTNDQCTNCETQFRDLKGIDPCKNCSKVDY